MGFDPPGGVVGASSIDLAVAPARRVQQRQVDETYGDYEQDELRDGSKPPEANLSS